MSKELKVLSIIFILLASFTFLLDKQSVSNLSEPQLSFSEFDEIIVTPIETISAVELASWLIKQEQHYNLIAVQNHDKDELSYLIPSADVHSYDSFLKLKIPTNETIFLYSNNEQEAIQLYYLLIIRGYFKVKVLQGGLASWHKQILYPNLSTIKISEQTRRKEITYFFAGNFNNQSEEVSRKIITISKKLKKHHGC